MDKIWYFPSQYFESCNRWAGSLCWQWKDCQSRRANQTPQSFWKASSLTCLRGLPAFARIDCWLCDADEAADAAPASVWQSNSCRGRSIQWQSKSPSRLAPSWRCSVCSGSSLGFGNSRMSLLYAHHWARVPYLQKQGGHVTMKKLLNVCVIKYSAWKTTLQKYQDFAVIVR